MADFLVFSFDVNDLDREVRAVEPTDKGRRVFQAELLNDIGPNIRRGRGRQRQGLHASETANSRSQLQIIRSKVMSPRRYAMRFVNREECQSDTLQRAD